MLSYNITVKSYLHASGKIPVNRRQDQVSSAQTSWGLAAETTTMKNKNIGKLCNNIIKI